MRQEGSIHVYDVWKQPNKIVPVFPVRLVFSVYKQKTRPHEPNSTHVAEKMEKAELIMVVPDIVNDVWHSLVVRATRVYHTAEACVPKLNGVNVR